MSKKGPSKPRNFVHKASIEINKPKVHRDRTKEYKNRTLKYEDFEHDHPAHRPYKRDRWLGEEEDEYGYEEEYEEADDYEEEGEGWSVSTGMEPPSPDEDVEEPSGERE